MRILFLGDIVGRSGRVIIKEQLPALREKLKLDFVIANAENAAAGFGLTTKICNELYDHGVDVIYVSNHGGRQLDHSVGSIAVLPDIVDAVDGRAQIAVDGGFYRGSDLVKAFALGADVVGIGRLEGWAQAAGGVPALVRCIALLKREVSMTMALCGVDSLAKLDRSFVTEADVVSRTDILSSAFPLIDEGY